MRRSRSRMRGGDEAKKVLGEPSVAAQDSADSKKMTHKDDDKNVTEGFGTMAGGRRRRRSQRRRSRRMSRRVARRTHRRRSQRRRGGMGNVRRTLAKAIVPFGLWGAQRLMRRKKNRKTMKRMGKRVTSLL
jgi:hypothetical protein